MIDWSGDFVRLCLFLCLFLFVARAYKRWSGLSVVPSFLSSLFHYYFQFSTIMSSPAYTSFPFSYREDACAQEVVESMEQVGDLASFVFEISL